MSLFGNDIHHVVDGDAPQESFLHIHDGDGVEVVLLHQVGYFLYGVVGIHIGNVVVENVLNLTASFGQNNFFERHPPEQRVVVVYYIYRIHILDVFGLAPDFFDTLRDGLLHVDFHQFFLHQAAGAVFVVGEQVQNKASLFTVGEQGYYFFSYLNGLFFEQVHGVVGVQYVDVAGDFFRRKYLQKLFASIAF